MTETAARADSKWNQGLLLITTAGPAGVSLVSSFVALKFLGTEAFGQWLAWRGFFLLLAIPTPGFNVAQQVLIAEALAANDTQRAEAVQHFCDRRSVLWVIGGSLLVVFASWLWYRGTTQAAITTSFALALLFSGLYAAAYTTSTIIGRKDSVRTVRGAYADVAGGLTTIAAALSGSVILYAASMGARYWLKAGFQYGPISPSPPGRGGRGVRETPGAQAEQGDGVGIDQQTRRVGVPMMLRAFVRDASQYGDKPVLSALYGNLIAGVGGVGSILATFAVMFANTATSYLLPVLIGADPREHGKLSRSAFMKVLHAMVVFALFVPAAHFLNAKVAERLDVVGLTYFAISGLALLSPIVVPWTARGQIWCGTITTGLVIAAVGCVLVGFGLFHLPVQWALALSVAIVFASVALILRDIGVIEAASPAMVALASLGVSGLAVAYSMLADKLPQPAAGVICPVLGGAYGLWAARGVLGSRAYP